MFDSTDGLPGPVIMKKLGKPAVVETQVGGGAVRPLLLQRDAVAAGDVDRHDGAGHRVEAGGVDDGIELDRLVGEVDAGLGDGADGRRLQVDEPDVRQVVRGEVVGVEARPLGAERVVLRAQQLGGVGIVTMPRIFSRIISATTSLASRLTPVSLKTPRISNSSPASQAASNRWRRTSGDEVSALNSFTSAGMPPREYFAAWRYAARSASSGARFSGRTAPLWAGHREVRGALEHGELRGLGRDERDGLDAGGAGADDRNALAGEVDALVRPAAGEVDLALETLGAGDVGRLRQRQAAGGHHEVAARDGLGAAVGGRRVHLPPLRTRRPTRRRRPGSRT